MRRFILLTALVIAAVPERAIAQEAATVSDLNWMAGCWASVGAEAGSGEQWMSPVGGTMFGMSRTVKNGKTVAHEFIQIRETEDGEIVFIADPSGQEGATFTMVNMSGSEVVFENLEHDFPQRIIYRISDGNLGASIEGDVNGVNRSIDFPMKRADCTES